MNKYYSADEYQPIDKRQAAFFSVLPAQIERAKTAPYFAKSLAAVDAKTVQSPQALATLPVIRKKDLLQLQKETPPFGGLAATALPSLRRVFASPGPIYDPEGQGTDWWRFARALYAAGFRQGDLIHNTFSYHFTPAGFMVESAAQALGCVVFPAGVGQTEMQVQAIADLQPQGYVGTPSFLKIILEKAIELKQTTASLQKALLSGEAFLLAQQEFFKSCGIEAYQAYASADLGLIAYETPARAGLVVDEGLWIEIVRPGSQEVLPEGEVGEVVVTTMNQDYPLIRFGTGDLSCLLPGISPCGRTHQRLKGWLGRADQSTKVKGMFVHPEQVQAVIARHANVSKARLVVAYDADGADMMTLQVESANHDAALLTAISNDLREITKLRGQVEYVAQGSIANDGKVIEDARPLP